jgi:hypothetical protein
VPSQVVFRSGRLEHDNGNCRYANLVQIFSDTTLPQANCKPNEVDVPDVRGLVLAKAKARLLQQPLLTRVRWTTAKPGHRGGIVVRQVPAKGTLSAYNRVTLVVSRGNERLQKREPAKP